MDIKAVLDLLEWLKLSNSEYDKYLKEKAPKLVKWRRILIGVYSMWAIFLTIDLLWAAQNILKYTLAKWIVGITVVLFILVFYSFYKFSEYNKLFSESESQDNNNNASKYGKLVDDAFDYVNSKYAKDPSKAVDMLLSNLINKRTEIINEYDKKVGSFSSAFMMFISAVLSILVKAYFEPNSDERVLFAIIAILFLVILAKVLNLAIRGLIKQPAWGRANQEIYLINILNDVKYKFFESDSGSNNKSQSSTTSESESVSRSITESQSVSNSESA